MGLLDGTAQPSLLDLLAFNLMQGQSSNFAQNVGNAGLQSMFQYNQLQDQNERRKFAELQLKQMQQQQADAEAKRSLASRFMQPGVQNLTPNDDEGNPMPTSPGKFDFGGYAGALAGVDPMASLQLQSMLQKEQPKVHLRKPEEDLIDETGKVIFKGTPKPDGPKVGQIREVESGDKKFTYEWNGTEWKKIADAPRFKPETDKPAAPQLYEGPNGPVWIQPPAKGSGAQPVLGPDQKALGPKMGQETKNELAKIDSEIQIIKGAQEAVQKTPSAFGMTRGAATLAGTIPESIAGRMDSSQERQARSYLYNVVSKVINERAGAAQSAQELARLRSFLPAETDAADQIKDKLSSYESYLREKRSGLAGSNPQSSGGWSIRAIQ